MNAPRQADTPAKTDPPQPTILTDAFSPMDLLRASDEEILAAGGLKPLAGETPIDTALRYLAALDRRPRQRRRKPTAPRKK